MVTVSETVFLSVADRVLNRRKGWVREEVFIRTSINFAPGTSYVVMTLAGYSLPSTSSKFIIRRTYFWLFYRKNDTRIL